MCACVHAARVCACLCVRVCVCVCACARARARKSGTSYTCKCTGKRQNPTPDHRIRDLVWVGGVLCVCVVWVAKMDVSVGVGGRGWKWLDWV